MLHMFNQEWIKDQANWAKLCVSVGFSTNTDSLGSGSVWVVFSLW